MCGFGVAILSISIYEGTGSRLIIEQNGIGKEAPIKGSVSAALFLVGLVGILVTASGLLLQQPSASTRSMKDDQ